MGWHKVGLAAKASWPQADGAHQGRIPLLGQVHLEDAVHVGRLLALAARLVPPAEVGVLRLLACTNSLPCTEGPGQWSCLCLIAEPWRLAASEGAAEQCMR